MTMELPGAIEHVRGAVVQVMYTISDLPPEVLDELGTSRPVFSRPFGSGFLVSADGYAITAKHVLDRIENFAIDYREDGRHYVGIGFAYPCEQRNGVVLRSNFRSIPFEVAGTDERNDLALLRLKANPFGMPERQRLSSQGQVFEPRVAALDPRRPSDGAAVAVSGFPLDQPVLITTAGHVASAWAADVEDAPSLDEEDEHGIDIADRFIVDVQTNSGAPTTAA
jgi:S1-C subfamily serine protease